MNGRILAERLLATTSVAALALAVMSPEAQAAACQSVNGGSFFNSGALNCISVTGNSVSVTNGPSGTISSVSNIGISVNPGVALSGSILNAGRIAIAAASPSFTAVGIKASGVVQGGITNSGTITVSNNAGFAAATGIVVNATGIFPGPIVNTGTVAAIVSGSSGALVAGLVLQNAGFQGGVTNSGTISAGGTISTGIANATGILICSCVGTFGGGISNSGSIAASVVATATTGASITAIALKVETSAFGGGIINSGTISGSVSDNGAGQAIAAAIVLSGVTNFSGGITNSATITAAANGIIADASAISIFAKTFNGGIVNSGTIAATATSSGFVATAVGLGIGDMLRLGGPTGTATNTFSGNISNSAGTISATLSGSGGGSAAAVLINTRSFLGNISNSGTISALAQVTATGAAVGIAAKASSTFAGNIVNSGTISASVTASGSGRATATGITLSASSFIGNITNSGTIAATITANTGTAKVAGILVNTTSFVGNISNSGTISAQVQTGRTATVIGISVNAASTFAGNIVNSGTISAIATVNGAAVEKAIGIQESTPGFSGTITNRGQISARAVSPSGTAIGVSVTSFAGSLANSGTISGVVSGAAITGDGIRLNAGQATIANSGTIQGSTWGIDLSAAAAASTISQNGGSIIGPTAANGAIRFSTFGDTLNINGGSIAGNLVGTGGTAPTVNIQTGAGGLFNYASTMNGIGSTNLNSGTLQLLNSGAATPGGTVNTTSYTQAAGTSLGIQVSATGGVPAVAGTGSVNATGTATLAGNLEAFETASPFVPGVTYNYTSVVTWGTLSGGFAAATSNSPLFAASMAQVGSSETLTISLLPASAVPGLNGDQKSVVTAINNIPGGNAFLDQVYTLNAGQLNQALNAVDGAQYTQNNLQPLLEAWQNFTDTLSNRLSIGEGYSGTMTGSYDPGGGVQFAQNAIPQEQAQAMDMPIRFASPVQSPWGVWMRGYGLTASAPATANSAPYTESGAGLIFGADKQMSDRLVAGLAVNIATDKANVVGGGSNLGDSYQGSAYAQYHMNENWYINGIAGFGWQTYSSARVVQIVTTETANAKYDGQSYRGYGETGYTLRPAWLADQSLRVSPFFGLGYLHAHTGAFTETGSDANLSVQAGDTDSLTTDIGFRASLVWHVGDSIFRPEIRAAWEHEWLDGAATVHSSLVQSPGSVLTATGNTFSRESFIGGAGMTTAVTSMTQLFIDYDTKVNGGYVANVISGGVRVYF